MICWEYLYRCCGTIFSHICKRHSDFENGATIFHTALMQISIIVKIFNMNMPYMYMDKLYGTLYNESFTSQSLRNGKNLWNLSAHPLLIKISNTLMMSMLFYAQPLYGILLLHIFSLWKLCKFPLWLQNMQDQYEKN